MPTRQPVVKAWVTELAAGLKPSMPDRELKVRIATAARELAAKYPEAAFTAESRQSVGAGFTEFPGADALDRNLAAWVADKGVGSGSSEINLLPGGEDPSLTIEDRHMLAIWLKHRAEGFQHISMRDFHDRMAQALSVSRKYSPRVFAYVVRTDAEAERIAMHRGWLEDASDRRRAHAPEDIEAVAASAARALAAMPSARRPQRSPDEQAEAVKAPPQRSRQDDLSLLAQLRADPRLPMRAKRIKALCRTLGVDTLHTDPQEEEPMQSVREPEDEPWVPREPARARVA